MTAIDLLLARASNPKLTDPGPDGAALDRILRAALRAPDHGAIRPWTIHVIRGEARARLGDAIAEVARRKNPDCTAEALDRARRKPLRAPVLFAVTVSPRPHPKVPEIEQLLSGGAVAHGLVLALQAEGFAGMWRTGDPAYAPEVKAALGVGADDAIVGFVYAGTPAEPAPDAPRPTLEGHVVEWTGPRSADPWPGA